MSRTVDQRVVEMRFDNRQFEQNVSTTMSTLEKLKNSLNLTGASKGMEQIDSAAKKVNLSGLTNAAENVAVKFSYMQATIQHQLDRIVDSAVNAGKRILSALTIDPIKTGFNEYELKMGSIQTIMASTGQSLEVVNGYLNELNEYSDKTIYSFSDMTQNIGKFTNAGVKLEDAVMAIKGISNEAAVSGANANEASRAMYNFAQALSAGYVKLIDWKSIELANMATVEFKQQLLDSAVAAGTLTKSADGMYETLEGNTLNATKNFNETLQDQWMTTEVLVNTLKDYADETTDIGKKAYAAAQDVKTLSQLFDTLKESAQSGWAQTWEILVGDLEEAKSTLTKISKVVGGILEASAKARNELLQGWKDAGGRTDLLEAFKSAFNGISAIVKPVKEAFRDIFPPVTVDQLVKFTKGFRELTKSFEDFINKHGDRIYSTFKGVFSVIDIGWTVVKKLASGIIELIGHFTGLSGGVLSITGAIGDWLSRVRDSVKETDIFGTAIDKIVDFLSMAIDKVKEFGKSLKDSFKFGDFLQGLWNVVSQIGSKIGDIFAPLANGITNVFANTNLSGLLGSGLLAGALGGVISFTDKLASPFKSLADMFESLTEKGGLFDGISDVLDSVRGSFEAYQNNLKADVLKKISVAIGILAASILVISSIDSEKLNSSLGAIGVMFAELLGAFALFSKMPTSVSGVTKASALMITMSTSVLILAAAMKTVSSLDWNGIAKGLVSVGVLMAELAGFLAIVKIDKGLGKTATGILILSSAILVLAKAVEDFGAMKWGEIGKGLAAIGALLLELGLFTKLTGNSTNVLSIGASMVLLGASMKIFASAMKDFATMSWGEIAKSLTAMGGALVELSLALRFTNGSFGGASSILVAAAALAVLVPVMKSMATMSWGDIGKGLVVMGGALAELAIALRLMTGTLSGAAALVVAAGALAVMAPVLKTLGGLSLGQITKGLIAIAGAFAVVGAAGVLLGPLVPTLLGLAGAFALFGLAAAGVGVGILAISAGFSALATAGVVGATAFVGAIAVIVKGILDLIPSIVLALGEIVLAVCKVLSECAPAIAETLLTVAMEVLGALAKYAPQIVDYLMEFLIGVLDALSAKLPELIKSAMELIGAFFQGIVDAIKGVDTTSLIEGIIGVGLIAALMYALSAIVAIIPGAMAGVLGMGVVIAELALVLAAIGALAQIPGLEWLISEGGDFLEKVGTAIGQFVGGIVGGVAKGVTSALPDIGTDLSGFMENAKPFIDGAKKIDAGLMDGVKSLAQAILILTAADILNGIAKFITGGSSLSDFGKELAEFGPHFKKYANSISGVNAAVVTASANAAKTLAEMAKSLPNKGGIVSWITGDNSLAEFGESLVPFGKSMKKYSDSVVGVNPAVVTASANSAKALSELASNLPNSGGIVSWFAGDNSMADFGKELVSFGKNFAKYAEYMSGVDSGVLTSTTAAAKSIVELRKSLPKDGGWFSDDMSLKDFGKDMASFGEKVADYYESISGVDSGQMSSTITQVNRLVNMLKNMAGIDASGAESFNASLKALAQNGITGFTTAFANAHSKAKTAVTNLINAAAQGITSNVDKFTSAGQSIIVSLISGMKIRGAEVPTSIANIISNALTRINSSRAQFTSAGLALMTAFSLGVQIGSIVASTTISTIITSIATRIRSKAVEFNTLGVMLMTNLITGVRSRDASTYEAFLIVVRRALTAIQSYYTNFYNAGGYLVQGFAAGITANTWYAEARARAMANAAYQSAMNELNAHSPSRLFMKVGSYVAQGFAIGIRDNTSDATSAASDMAASTVSTVKTAIARIADVINSDIDTQPTIRPVLDLSNVESGTRKLQAVFSRKHALSVSSDMERSRNIITEDSNVDSKTGNTFQFTQINNSPKALSRDEIYRQTNNQFSVFERMVKA